MAYQPRDNPEYRAVCRHLANSTRRTPTDVAVGANEISVEIKETVSTVAAFPLRQRVNNLAAVAGRGRRISEITASHFRLPFEAGEWVLFD
jgi:hypothetical protein